MLHSASGFNQAPDSECAGMTLPSYPQPGPIAGKLGHTSPAAVEIPCSYAQGNIA